MNQAERMAVRAAFAALDGKAVRFELAGGGSVEDATTQIQFLMSAALNACDALDAADQRAAINAAVIVELHGELARLEARLREPPVSC